MKAEKSLFLIILIVFVAAAAVLLIRKNTGNTEEHSVSSESLTEQVTDSSLGEATEGTAEEETEIYFDTKTPIVEKFVENIGTSGADSMLLSMYPVRTYNEEILYTQMLTVAEILDEPFDNGMQLVAVLETILGQPHTLNKVFLGIHTEGILDKRTQPLNLSYQSEILEEGYSWEGALAELAKRNPDITFEVVLYYPSISSLTTMDPEMVEGMIDWYGYVAGQICDEKEIPNLHLFMPGCEEWLICNEDNYQDAVNLTAEVADELERLIFCQYHFMVTQDNVNAKSEKLRQLVQEYQSKQMPADKEGYTYVFLGDSVIGNYSGSLSIPGIVSYMTGADVINCGYGGLAATKRTPESAGLQDVIDKLLETGPDREVDSLGNENVKRGIKQFWNAGFEKETDRLAFFLYFGINDYMSGHPVYNKDMNEACYKGALQKAVEALQEAYPNAEIILMTPNLIARGDFGVLPSSEEGAPYMEYIQAVKDLGQEKGFKVVDIYGSFTFTTEEIPQYLEDLCHPNYQFRFEIGEKVRDRIANP